MGSESNAIVFFCYAVVNVVVCGFAFKLAVKRRDLPGFVCTPIAISTLVFENIALALEQLSDNTSEDLTRVRFVVHSLVVPLFIITCFELGYQVHKKRGVNYCCIRFEEGHRNQSDVIAQLLRFSPWMLAITLCILSIVANVDNIEDPLAQSSNRFSNESLSFSDNGLSDIMDFLPPLCLVAMAAYAGVSLWKYGTYYAMEVHATTLNPWLFLFLAAIFALLAALLTPESWSGPFLTNGAELFLATAVVHATFRVHMNLEEIKELGSDLAETNQMSKDIQARNRRTNPKTAPPAVGGRGVVAKGAVDMHDVDIELGGGGNTTRPRGAPRRGKGPGPRRSPGRRGVRGAGMAVVAARRASRQHMRRGSGRRGSGRRGGGGRPQGSPGRASSRRSPKTPRRPPSQQQLDDDVYDVGGDDGAQGSQRQPPSGSGRRMVYNGGSRRAVRRGGGGGDRRRASPRGAPPQQQHVGGDDYESDEE